MRLRKISLLAVIGFALAGCGTSAATLEDQPEAALYYPGSHVILGSSRSQSVVCIDDCHSADRDVELETSANPTQIMAWYDAKLKARGWTPDSYSNGIDVTHRSWQRPGGSRSGYHFSVVIGLNGWYPATYSLPFQSGMTYFRVSFAVPDS